MPYRWLMRMRRLIWRCRGGSAAGELDEAMTHYKKCLTLDPVPKTRKAAEKALKEMTAGG